MTEKEELNKSFDRLKWVFRHLKLESEYGKKALFNLKPFKPGEEKELRNYFQKLDFIISIFKEKTNLFSNFNSLFMELRNISGSLTNLNNNMVLGETELFELKNFAIIVSRILDLAKEMSIIPENLCNLDLMPIIKLLNPDKILTRSFYIHESWTENLQGIREEKNAIEVKILSAKSSQEKDRLRAERAVLVSKERDEELNARKYLSEELKKYEELIKLSVDNIGAFELLLAKAELATSNICNIPIVYDFDSDSKFILEGAIEPEILETLKKHNKAFTPVSIQLQRGVTLLTGANMGGKSVSLRTIALNTELARFGFLPFAEKMTLKIPEFIQVISGDLQDSNSGLSSFGAEVKELCSLLKKVDGGSGLVICDELARSTNPYEGSRFVQALSEKLQSSSSYGIIATHYDGIKTAGAAYYQVVGLKNLLKNNLDNDKFSQIDLSELMDYHLEKVSENSDVPHDALKIAAILGLPKEFIESLKKYYDNTINRC